MKNIILAFLLSGLGLQPSFAADKKASGVIEFPSVPEIPVPEGMGYDHYFQKNQPVKLVFGVSDPGFQLKESLVNAAYTIKYLKPRGIKYQIQLVLYSKAVLPANSFNEKYGGYSELMTELSEQGVEFVICNNSLVALDQSIDDLYPYMKVIPAGILQIAKKQMQGYSYIHNTK